MRRAIRPVTITVVLVLAAGFILVAGTVWTADAQSDSTPTGRIVAGATLGLYSGGLASNIGSTLWCTQTGWGAGCIRTFTMLGGVLGATAGGFLADGDVEALERAAVRSAIGFGIGAAFGTVSKYAKSAVGWRDALMLGAIGGAIGAKPFGAALGFSGGLIMGFGLSSVIPGFGLPEIAATTLAGMAVGLLTDWVLAAEEAHDHIESPTLAIPLVRISL